MQTRPVDLLWHILRDDETKSRRVIYKFIWTDKTWCSETGTNEELFQLYKTLGTPIETRITDIASARDTFRCNICGGLVQFDGTPPRKEEPCSSPSAATG